jgi:hypothetical protein
MRPPSPALRKLRQKVNAAVEAQAPIRQDINPLSLEICGSVDNADIASLHEVIRDEKVLLIRADVDVVRSGNTLVCIWIIQSLDVVEVGDVEGGDVVAQCQGEVGEFAVVGDVGVDGEIVACARPEVEEQFGDALLALRVLAERVDDPDLARTDSGREGGGFFVAWDELDVLDASTVRDGYCVDDLARGEFPEAERVGFWIPLMDAGLRMVSGTTKSEVRMILALKSMERPWGLNCSPRMLSVPSTSSGHSWMMLKLASVSTRRPGEVPRAEPM